MEMDKKDRDYWMRMELSQRVEEFTTEKPFNLFVGSWNVNNQSPPDTMLRSWLAADKQPPDIYVIGLQELETDYDSYLPEFASTKEEEWKQMVLASLYRGVKYNFVKSVRLIGICLMVFIRDHHYGHVFNISLDDFPCGREFAWLGNLGNKGGVGISFRIHTTEFCFVNSHLAAHTEFVEKRNEDFHSIYSGLTFSKYDKEAFFTPIIVTKRISNFDKVFWMGDLNYRVHEDNGEGEHERVCRKVKDMIDKDQIDEILPEDQLNRQRRLGNVFQDFNEGQITFRPTFKYDVGTNNWDSSLKNRTPAWCDRILWKGDEESITQIAYRSHPDFFISDHKPVSALFNVNIRVFDDDKLKSIQEEIMRKFDNEENKLLPQVEVLPMVEGTPTVKFDEIKFMETVTETTTIKNTGLVPVHFEFVPVPDLERYRYGPEWLTAEPSTGIILAGHVATVNILINVNKKTAHRFNIGKEDVNHFLVLDIYNDRGKIHKYVTIEGKYKRSSFGGSINGLVQLTVPIADISTQQIEHLEKGEIERLPSDTVLANAENLQNSRGIPKEIWFLCDLLTTHSDFQVSTGYLFLMPGEHEEILAIRNWLDTGHPIGEYPDVNIHSVATAIKIFLDSLREPVIPYSLYERCLQNSERKLQCLHVVNQLPTNHRILFDYLTGFLKEVISYNSDDGQYLRILTTMFSSIFVRDPPNSEASSTATSVHRRFVPHDLNRSKSVIEQKVDFLSHFLVEEDSRPSRRELVPNENRISRNISPAFSVRQKE